jgi:opacity protein-like surface antigen
VKKILTLGLALASLSASLVGAAGVAQARPEQKLILVQDEWRDCGHWDRKHHVCRDPNWDRNRWNEHDWYGRGVCGANHDHYLDARGHWRTCR